MALTAAVLGASLLLALLIYALPSEIGAAIVREAAAREMDFHRRFTTVSIEKDTYLGFFASRLVPWPEKLAVGFVALAVAQAFDKASGRGGSPSRRTWSWPVPFSS